MKTIGILSLLLCLLMYPVNCNSEEVLYWMVDETSQVHYSDGTSQYMPMFVPSAEDSSLAARVRVSGGVDGDVFLDLYFTDGVDTYRWSGEFGLDFEDPGSGYWGCGVPVGNQSPLADYASPEFAFMIEIGNYSYNEATDTENWTTIAQSASTSYSSLKNYIFTTFDINPPTTKVWNPHDYYAVPEPSCDILLLFGISLLFLRRPKNV